MKKSRYLNLYLGCDELSQTRRFYTKLLKTHQFIFYFALPSSLSNTYFLFNIDLSPRNMNVYGSLYLGSL